MTAPHRRRTTTSSCRSTPRTPWLRGYATTYDPAYAPGTGYAPAAPWGSYDRPRRPRNPRKRGPILFWFTLALIALAEGVLGVVDLAGVAVADSAYPALALGITALMLLVGSFWGRAGGLILLGLVAALATAAATIGSSVGEREPLLRADQRRRGPARPTSSAAVASPSTCPTSPTSRRSTVATSRSTVSAVEVEVVVPDGMDVDVSTQVVGGQSQVFDQRSDGFDITQDGFLDGGDDVPDMSITIDLVGGEIVVREAA